MHELSIATAVLNTAIKHAEGRPVTNVCMRVGRLRQVVPDSLRFYFEVVRRDTVCHGATLELIDVEARAKCLACETEWDLGDPLFRCPACASAEVMITSGQELEVEYIEVDEPRPSVSRPTR